MYIAAHWKFYSFCFFLHWFFFFLCVCTESFFTMTSVMSYCTDLNLEFSRVNNSHLFSVRNILERVPCPVRILWWGEKVNFMISRVPTGKCGNLFFSFHVSRNLTAISAVAHLSTRDLPSGTHTLHHVAFTCGLRNVLKWVLFGAKIFSFGGGGVVEPLCLLKEHFSGLQLPVNVHRYYRCAFRWPCD